MAEMSDEVKGLRKEIEAGAVVPLSRGNGRLQWDFDQALTDEKLEVVEVLGQTALFTNGRVTEQELPEGLYRYDLREGENLAFATIERNVAVNHAGTILTKAPLDFGGQEYFVFDDDTSPNFLGYDLTPEEFLQTDFTQTDAQEEDTAPQMGGIQS